MTDDALTIDGREAAAPTLLADELEAHIAAGTNALLDLQKPDGHWVFELEADSTIPAEYVLMMHYRGEPADPELERKIAAYLMRIQGAHGGWPREKAQAWLAWAAHAFEGPVNLEAFRG